MPVVYSRAGVFLLLLFSLVDPLKFGYACEMSPLTTAGLLIKSRDPYIGSRIFGGAQVIGGTFYGTIVGALAVSTNVPDSGCACNVASLLARVPQSGQNGRIPGGEEGCCAGPDDPALSMASFCRSLLQLQSLWTTLHIPLFS